MNNLKYKFQRGFHEDIFIKNKPGHDGVPNWNVSSEFHPRSDVKATSPFPYKP